jgi:hypothetical protein
MALNGEIARAPGFENYAKGSDRDLILDIILEFFLEEPKKISKNLSYDRRSLNQDFNPRFSEL